MLGDPQLFRVGWPQGAAARYGARWGARGWGGCAWGVHGVCMGCPSPPASPPASPKASPTAPTACPRCSAGWSRSHRPPRPSPQPPSRALWGGGCTPPPSLPMASDLSVTLSPGAAICLAAAAQPAPIVAGPPQPQTMGAPAQRWGLGAPTGEPPGWGPHTGLPAPTRPPRVRRAPGGCSPPWRILADGCAEQRGGRGGSGGVGAGEGGLRWVRRERGGCGTPGPALQGDICGSCSARGVPSVPR